MEILIANLNKYFEKETCLKNFLPMFKQIIKYNKINFFKKEYIQGTYNKEIIYKNSKYEIVLITWGANSSTLIHCHPKNGCLLSILSQGELIEERYEHNGKLYEENILKTGDIGYMHCKLGKHKVINKTNKNVYSLHIYSPPGFYN